MKTFVKTSSAFDRLQGNNQNPVARWNCRHLIAIDMEHGPQSTAEVLRLGRTITHLGMVPLVHMPELSRTQVQRLLDGGIQVLALPDVRSAGEAARFVELGKYPPQGQRGVSSSSAGTDFTMGPDPRQRLREANEATHLMW